MRTTRSALSAGRLHPVQSGLGLSVYPLSGGEMGAVVADSAALPHVFARSRSGAVARHRPAGARHAEPNIFHCSGFRELVSGTQISVTEKGICINVH
ncbi:hypothetical protein ORI20_06545 [Mycobacterium sp. CVI_P3]|uniref:Uncharacterized protein n=1 Tax=Mycobacterium pinniadriaticum TaxID=2994102 RepID=A0ABT3SA87_9MYCO|nr:hypothetical protein [Mycobacterium pinniadriaticum]MCX2929923.1 hypothetical protein [Mycobacterium pinniadriaticum]MCX2936428.1 hypothetical protein [Mycobacterium pinniadriaticum]